MGRPPHPPPQRRLAGARALTYTPDEIEWLEREWAYRAFGRAGFMSPEDYRTWKAWEAAAIPMDLVVGALNAYFDRRDKRSRPRTFVALKHLEKDVAKAVKLREALHRAGPELTPVTGWEGVAEPLAARPEARLCFEAWRRARAALPSPEDPGYLARFDAEREAFAALVQQAEAALGPEREALAGGLAARLRAAELPEGGPVWQRAWRHHWAKVVLDHWRIPFEV